MPDIREPRVHARFLAYRERHVYFGRGEHRTPLSAEAFAALDAELGSLVAVRMADRTPRQLERLDELRALLHLD
jgi:hypothetical protein